MLNTNVSPYFDDFNPLKNYFQELFVPGRAVQGRELSQIQSLLQNQIQNNASHFFQDGSSIINSAVSITFEQEWVELAAIDQSSNAVTVDDSWIGRIFIGETSGATFKVNAVDAANRRLYVLPFGGTYQNENIDIDPAQDNASPTSIPATITNFGKAVRANSESGIVYANGFFVSVAEQEVIVQPTGVDGNYFVGYQYVDSFITESDDASLADPASGSTNANAPGAHRLKVELQLTSYEATETVPDNFYSFITIQDGVVVQTHNSVQYADIMDLLAGRTFDESGDYTVSDFPITVEQDPVNEDKIDIFLDAGNAYVQGYNFRTIAPTKISIDKPRTAKLANNVNVYSSYGTFFLVDNIFGGVFDVSKKETVQLFSGVNGTGTEIGATNTIRIVGIHNISPNVRAYLSGVSDLQSVLSSVRSIVSGSKVINVLTRDIDQDRLTGTVTEALYGISPNPAPVFPVQHKRVQDIVLNETIYDSQKSFIGFTNKVSSDFVVNADDAQTDFDVGSPIVAIYETGTGTDLSSLAVPSVSNINGGTSSVTISGLGVYASIDVILRTQETQSNPKTKNLTETSISFTASGTTHLLSHFDIFEIVSVTKGGAVVDPSTIGLDNGQRDFYYEFGVLTGLEDAETYDVTYRYFSHSGTGDYFSINSYINVNNTTFYPDIYGRIGSYSSEDGLVQYELTDCLDYRRTITDISSGTDIPTPESSIFVDYNYYLPRVDKVYISREGAFGVETGIPSDFADEPNDVPNTMTLYTLDMEGYVVSPQEVRVRQEDNKRYTMRGIGELEKRIENLEYYTALSLVENETNSLIVLDENGNNKFKNGILVDSFQDHSIGDVDDELYLASIDEEEQYLRPSFDVNSYDFLTQQEIYDGAGFSVAGVSVNENTYTLEFTETPMIEQLRASETINVNPYNVFVWYGDIKLTPNSDNWVDTKFKPSVTVSIDGNVDAFRTAANFMGTKWNSWQTNWTGTTSSTKITGVSRGRTTVDRSNWRQGPHGTWLTRVTDVTTTRQVTTTRKTAQTRTGRRLNVGSKWVKRDLGSRVVDTRVVPFIRPRNVGFSADGFKPNTTLRALFDGQDVTNRCTATNPANPTGTLVTNAAGQITGTFSIQSGRFKTGTRDFVLIDDEVNPSTQGKTNYTASGILQTKEKQILSIEQPVITTSNFTQNRVLTSTSSRSTTEVTQERSRPYDPIAQSFFVDEEGGVFINSVEVFFESKDNNLPVSLEIVSNDNGYPSTFTLPFAKTILYPNDVNISADGSVGTIFRFSDPVYLEHLGDYSFVMKSNSNQYEVFIAKIGGTDLISGKLIADQPYIGSLFKSQNAFTWNADQERDIKFIINRCSFNVNPANLFLQDNAGVTNQNFTSFMPNIDELSVEGTFVDMFYKVAASGIQDLSTSGYTQITNKTNVDLNAQESFDSANEPFRVIAGLNTSKETISPVIHRYRNSFIGVNNYSTDDGGSNLDAGRYITRSTTLAEAADDLKVLIDVEKPSGADIEVFYKVGEILPKHIDYNSSQVKIDSFEGRRLYVYHISSTNVASLQGSFVSTNIDDSSARVFAKQITDIGMFIDSGDWATNGLNTTRGVIVTTETDLDGQTINNFGVNSPYRRLDDDFTVTNKTFVLDSNKIWKSVVNNNTNAPSSSSYAWEEVLFLTLESTLQDNVKQDWQEMILETSVDASVDTTNFVEYNYKPKDSIKQDFTQYSIMVNMRVTDPARVPLCRELRVLALS